MSAGGDDAWWRGLGPRLLLYLGIVFLVGGTVSALSGGLPGPYGQHVATLVGALVAGWTLLALHGHGPGALGFGLRPGLVRETALGTALGVLLLVPVLAALAASGSLVWSGDGGSVGAWARVGLRSLAWLGLAAAAEEAFFRGYPLQALAQRWGAGWAVASTSVLFGALHLGNPSVGWLASVNVAVAGAFLGVLALRTGSLWWVTGAHLGWNWGQAFLADLRVSGLERVDTPFWDGALSGPAWWAGGGFGVEGSVLTTAAMGAAAWLCWRTPRLAPEGPRWWTDDDDRGSGGEAAGGRRDSERDEESVA